MERVRLRLKAWQAKQAVKSILDSILMAVSRNRTVMEIKNILEEVTEVAEKEGKSRKLFSEMVEFGLIDNIKMKISMEERSKRLSKKLEMERNWWSKRSQKKEDDVPRPPEKEFDMEWEEHRMEACLAMLAIEAWDRTEPMSIDELEEKED